ncbi:hypothetical protein [Halorubrum sp. HHNYT27]|uniref:transcriptional regulator FilR1 domain-containing protein n=1 Tax=Halorubrum sp. HHNYT27 TaxID=3402275 RepID=UPI003EB8EBD0
MSDDGPGASLRAFVLAAVGDDLASPADEVTVVERGDDPDPAARVAALLERTGESDGGDAVVGVIPRADPSLARRVTRDLDAETRLVFTGSAAQRLGGPAGAPIRSALAARGVKSYRHEGETPVAVLLVGDRAVVGLFDERGLAAVLWSDAASVREWAAATCRRYLAAAEPM